MLISYVPQVAPTARNLQQCDQGIVRHFANFISKHETGFYMRQSSTFFSSVFSLAGPDARETEKDSFLTKTVGVQALFDVLRETAASALEERDFSQDRFIKKLQPLGGIDFSNEGFQQASGQGRSLIGRVVLFALDIEQPRLRKEQISGAKKLLEAAKT